MVGSWPNIRGFATNVANYQPLGKQCPGFSGSKRNDYCLNGGHKSDECCADPCNLESQYNPGNNELNYVAALHSHVSAALGFDPYFIVDTGRNGVANMRKDCANWCNARGAGAGLKSTTSTGSFLKSWMLWLGTL